jgi:hypothetical protein
MPSRILCIGDGVITDIAGANAQGLDSLFIAAGIHGEALQTNGKLDPAKVDAALAAENVARHLRNGGGLVRSPLWQTRELQLVMSRSDAEGEVHRPPGALSPNFLPRCAGRRERQTLQYVRTPSSSNC